VYVLEETVAVVVVVVVVVVSVGWNVERDDTS